MELRDSIQALEGMQGRWAWKLYRDLDKAITVYAESEDGKAKDILFRTFGTVREAKAFIGEL